MIKSIPVKVASVISLCVFGTLVFYNVSNTMPSETLSSALVLLAYVSLLVFFFEWRYLPSEKRYSRWVGVGAGFVAFVALAITVYGFNTVTFEPL